MANQKVNVSYYDVRMHHVQIWVGNYTIYYIPDGKKAYL